MIFSSNSIIPESPKSLIAKFPDKIAPLLEVKHPVYTSFVRKTINADKWQWAARRKGKGFAHLCVGGQQFLVISAH